MATRANRLGDHVLARPQVRAKLNQLRRMGRLPSLSRDDLKDAFSARGERNAAPAPEPRPLGPVGVRKLLQAAIRHDTDPRYQPVAPLLLFMLLGGCRWGEAAGLARGSVELDATDATGAAEGRLIVKASSTKNRKRRPVDLGISPALRRLLAALLLRGDRCVFGGRDVAKRSRYDMARRRLVEQYGVAPFTWQTLRQTCVAYAVCAPRVFGSSASYMSASRHGHGVAVAERFYLQALSGLSEDARTLEGVMGIEDLVEVVLAQISGERIDVDEHPALRETA